MPIDERILDGRRRVIAVLDELRSLGLLRYTLTPPVLDGPEPHLDVWAGRDEVDRSAWGLGVSREAAYMWDLMRGGTFNIAPSLQALLNVLDARGRV